MLGTWGLNQFQHRQAKQVAERQEQHAAYQEVLNRSRTFAARAKTLGDAMRFRSGLNESLSVLEVMDAATARPDRSLIVRAYRALAGGVWTQKQLADFDNARDRLDEEQAAFVKVIRKEMGKEAVELALERAERKARELPGKDPKVT